MPIVERCHELQGVAGCDGDVGDEARCYRALASYVGKVAKLERPCSWGGMRVCRCCGEDRVAGSVVLL